jgi:hypothetical protein
MKEKNKKLSEQEAEETRAQMDEDIIVVQEATKISDGIHNGQIKNIVHEKRQGFDYIDVYVDIEDDNGNYVTIKTGFPAYISQNSSLGRFLTTAGFVLKPKDKIHLQDIKDKMIGKPMTFQSYTEDNFAKVINKTIKF